MRKLIVLVVFALAVAACGGSTEPETAAAEPTAAPETTSAPQEETTTAPSAETSAAPEGESEEPATTEAAGPSFDGPPAPDFELALADGSTFRLSDEQKPVYIVFWAEW